MTETIGVFLKDNSHIKFDADERARLLARYRTFYSGRPVDARAFVYEGKEYTGASNYAKGDIDRLIKSGGTDGFDPEYRHILGGIPKNKRCGEATWGGMNSVSFATYGCDDRTSVHEWHHNGKPKKGMGHSHRARSGGVTPMGDNTSLMGSGTVTVGMVAPHIDFMGWAEPDAKIVIESSQQVLIHPLESAGYHVGSEFKYVIVRVRGFNDFYLSVRQHFPFDCGDLRLEKLYIHEFYPKGSPDVVKDAGNSTVRYDDLMPGGQAELPNGATVNYLDNVFGTARVEVTL